MESSFNVVCTPKRVVLGSVDQNNGSPISPMANLKLLTKVATSYMDENSTILPYPDKLKKTPVKNQRQLRSLGYICKKFLGLYNLDLAAGHSKQISLGNLTSLLDIEKRRVYDIINIIASLRYASKVCKDKYSWFGNQYLVATLCELRNLAFNRKYHLLLQKCLNNNMPLDIYDHNLNLDGDEKLGENDQQIFDDNRIGALCQKSMMLFLIAPKGEPLNFRVISQIILPRDIQDKTGMRRLYDISNVLESLGLIQRCDSKHMKRPTFLYSGPELPTDTSDILPISERLTDIEHLSDTSLDGSESKISNIFDIVTTEIQEMEKVVKTKFIEPQFGSISAKKQLFPEKNIKLESGFIKAPQSSFKFTSAGIVKLGADHRSRQFLKLETQSVVTPSFARMSDLSTVVQPKSSLVDRVDEKMHGSIIRINKIARPLSLYKISSGQNVIQNGGIYKVVKQGNIINFVQLKSAH